MIKVDQDQESRHSFIDTVIGITLNKITTHIFAGTVRVDFSSDYSGYTLGPLLHREKGEICNIMAKKSLSVKTQGIYLDILPMHR